MTRTLVIGCGNPLRRDDAVAWHVIDALRKTAMPAMKLLTVHQLTPELAEEISGANTVIFVDASAETQEVKVEMVVEMGVLDRGFTHSVCPHSLVFLAREMYGRVPARIFLVSIGVSTFDLGEGLTASAMEGVHEAVRRICELAEC
jgi:hydrogenase maturation protease